MIADLARQTWALMREESSRKPVLIMMALIAILIGIGVQTASAASGAVVISHGGDYASVVLDSAGNPVIAYYDTINSDLVLARCYDPTCSSGLSTQIVDHSSTVGLSPSLVLDSNGYPVISYGAPGQLFGPLKLVRCNDLYCGGGDEWFRYIGSGGTESSLALDNNGNAVIAFFASQYVMLFRCSDVYCLNPSLNVIHQSYPVWDPELVLDAQGFPVVSFIIADNNSNPGDLKLIHCNDIGCAGSNESVQTFDIVNSAYQASLALDAAGNPVLSYRDSPGLMLMHCNDNDCKGGGESIQTVALANHIYDTHLALDSTGNPVISYASDPGAILVTCNDPNCAGANEKIRTIESGGSVSDIALALTSSGVPLIAYNYIAPPTDDLRLAICDSAACPSWLDVAGAGSGSGTMTAPGIACSYSGGVASGDCSEAGGVTSLSVVAVANPGSMFVGWEGCASRSTTNPATPGDTCHVMPVINGSVVRARFRQSLTPMHVADIRPEAILTEGTIWWTARATITVVDDEGYPWNGVTVTARWNYGTGQTIKSCVTNSQGRCSVSLVTRYTMVTFTVSNLASGSFPYDPEGNVVTSVTICNPGGEGCE